MLALKILKNCFTKKGMFVRYVLRSPAGRFFSDKFFINLEYIASFGKKPNLDNPKTYNEKLQWLKLYDRNPQYVKMVDKYQAKSYVADIIGKQHIIPTLGVYDSFDEIDFSSLPEQFVIKCTHDCGGLVICKDKTQLDMENARKKIEKSLKRNYYYNHREWPYKNVKPRIIAEEFLENDGENGLVDYKFYCFDGKPEFLYISKGLENHATAQISFYDTELNRMPFKRNDFRGIEGDVQKPENFEEMLDIAAKLSAGFPFIRVDLYNLNGKIYFSELTFYPCSGYMPFDKPEWDEKIGAMLTLPSKKL